ncbi:MAG: tetratricopeptide repeat protein [Candidatus Omnitrophota bacterium]|nr:tetratricopeptide repeat protein [Candidatus Omnitrophota bacterium]
MGSNPDLLSLRIALDQAITYGTQKEAFAIAVKALKESEDKAILPEIEYFRGQVKMLEGDYRGAALHFQEVLRHNPSDGAAYNDWALSLVELGIIDEVLVLFDKGIVVEPDYATIYHNKGWLLNNIGRHSEAVACFNQALNLEPDRAVTYDNLADALFNLGEYRRAFLSYRKVLELLPLGSCAEIRQEILVKLDFIEKEFLKSQKKEGSGDDEE